MIQFRQDLRPQLEERGISLIELAFAAGISLSSVNRAVRGEPVSAPVFGKIIRALGAIQPVSRHGRAASAAPLKSAGKTRGGPSRAKR